MCADRCFVLISFLFFLTIIASANGRKQILKRGTRVAAPQPSLLDLLGLGSGNSGTSRSQPVPGNNPNSNSGSSGTGFSTSTGLSAAGSGFQEQQGLGFNNGKLTIGKSTGIQAVEKEIFSGGDQASVDFSQGLLPNICRQQNLGVLGNFFGQQNGGCVNLAPLSQLFNTGGNGGNQPTNLSGFGGRKRRQKL